MLIGGYLHGMKWAFHVPLVLMFGAFIACGPGSQGPSGDEDLLGKVADSAMVVSAHPIATAVGVEILQAGGNAVDAAVAVHWALAVVAPWAGNIGGGGFAVVRLNDGRALSLDFRETAPAAATRDMYLDTSGTPIPLASELGHRSVGVPGSVAGLFALHDSLGSLPMERLIQPAIDLAAHGCTLTPLEAREMNDVLASMRRHCTRPNAFTAREKWSPGALFQQPDLAHSLERIRDAGRAGFYEGTTAQLILEEMQRGKGIVTAADLVAYKPVWRPVVEGTYRDLGIISMAPPSSGGVLLVQLLNAMEPVDVTDLGWQRTATVHRMIEAERRAYADRAALLGDPGFVAVPLDQLLDKSYTEDRMTDFDEERATPSAIVAAGEPVLEPEHTTHFSIVDAQGNAVSCTTTLNSWYGSAVVVGGAGFVLNNEMDDFSIAPGRPNSYGLVGGEANAIAPGKRMLSSMAPSILTQDGELFMVIGSPGGSTIPTSVLQVIMNVVDHGMNMQEAVEAPRFHSQWLPDSVFMEVGAIAKEDSLELVSMGHVLKVRKPIGRVDAIRVLDDGRLEGGADPRGDDAAGGY